MHSLRTKIALLAVTVSVLAVAVVSMLSVLFIQNAEHKKSEQLLYLLCQTGERNLDYYFSSVERSVQKVSAYAEKEMDGLTDEQLKKHCEQVSRYFDVIANKTNGVLTYYYRIDPAVSDTVKGFWYINLDGDGFSEHEVTDITRYDVENTENLVWFTVPRKTGGAIWLPPYITDNLDRRVISYNVPISYRGQFVGVIGIEIDYSTLEEQVKSIRLYNNGYAFLTDAEGNLMLHSRIDLAKLPEDRRPAAPDGLLSESIFTHYTYENVDKAAAWLRLSNGMRLYVSVPVEETEGDWQQLIRQVLIAAGIVILLSVLITRLFTERITRPLKQLTEAAVQADVGNYDFALDYNGRDEVGTLTKTFRRMAEHMKNHIRDLSNQVYVDALTSVRNKGAFSNYVEELQKKLQVSPENREFAVGVFDCNDLKTVNDQYGHDKGDLYLKAASRLICLTFQHSPVFRIGGDEFAVILQNDDYRNRERLIAKFERDMAETVRTAENRWQQVYMALGFAAFDPNLDHSVIDTVRRADKTMYTHKRSNKNISG